MQALHIPSAKIFTHGGFFPQVGPWPGCTQCSCNARAACQASERSPAHDNFLCSPHDS